MRYLPLLIFFALANNCGMMAKPGPPDLEIVGFELLDFNLQEAKGRVNMLVNNEYDVDINLPKIAFTIFVEGEEFLPLETTKNTMMAKKSKSPTDVDFTLNYQNVIKAIKALAGKNEFAYNVDGIVTLDTSKVPVYGEKNPTTDLPFDWEGKMPIPDFEFKVENPDFEIETPSVGSLIGSALSGGNTALLKVHFTFDLLVINKNGAKIKAESISTQMTIGRKAEITTKIASNSPKPGSGGVTKFAIKNTVEVKPNVVSLLDGGSIPYKLAGEFKVGLPAPLGSYPIDWSMEGKF